MFIDRARIFIKSGRGGNGKISFLRSKYIPFGGPDGGNGGKGGDLYFQGDRSLNTLLDFKFTKSFMAENGHSGEENNKTGKEGQDLTIKVPLGTEVRLENGETIEILTENPQLILRGGHGGIGNGCLANSVNQAPKFNYPPGEAEEMFAELKLKIIGDIGLIGMPNAGKSSFINECTNSKSLVGDYEFTTLEPKLGTYEKMILVDIPGLIEGASSGKGLGFQFLSHVERCQILLMIIDINNNPNKALQILTNELKLYGIEKTFVIALNKIELIKAKNKRQIIREIQQNLPGVEIFPISVHRRSGIKTILKFLNQNITNLRQKE